MCPSSWTATRICSANPDTPTPPEPGSSATRALLRCSVTATTWLHVARADVHLPRRLPRRMRMTRKSTRPCAPPANRLSLGDESAGGPCLGLERDGPVGLPGQHRGAAGCGGVPAILGQGGAVAECRALAAEERAPKVVEVREDGGDVDRHDLDVEQPRRLEQGAERLGAAQRDASPLVELDRRGVQRARGVPITRWLEVARSAVGPRRHRR